LGSRTRLQKSRRHAVHNPAELQEGKKRPQRSKVVGDVTVFPSIRESLCQEISNVHWGDDGERLSADEVTQLARNTVIALLGRKTIFLRCEPSPESSGHL